MQKRKNYSRNFIGAILSVAVMTTAVRTQADEDGEEVFEYTVGEVSYLTGEGVSVGGFLFPELFVIGTGGVFEPGAEASDFANGEHDPANDVGIQGIELDVGINIDDIITGAVVGFGHQGEDEVWEAELEEAFLHYHLTENIAIGGGQFLNRFGFQADQHQHGWSFVNQNLNNARALNEGELITQGFEIIVKTPGNSGELTIGGGGVRSHAEEEEAGPPPPPTFIEAHEGEFTNEVYTADYRFRLPFDDSVTVSTSFGGGENGFGRDTLVYGFGVRKVWNGHDHGNGGPEFCVGALQAQTEFLGRNVDGFNDGGAPVDFDDQGVSTSILYGLCESATLSLRHDWISAVNNTEFVDSHRISPALTVAFGKNDRIQTRLQYDYIQNDEIESEHAVWFQVQIQWGGDGGSHAGHDH